METHGMGTTCHLLCSFTRSLLCARRGAGCRDGLGRLCPGSRAQSALHPVLSAAPHPVLHPAGLTQVCAVVLELLGELLQVRLAQRDHLAAARFLQHSPGPVIGTHSTQQDSVLVARRGCFRSQVCNWASLLWGSLWRKLTPSRDEGGVDA